MKAYNFYIIITCDKNIKNIINDDLYMESIRLLSSIKYDKIRLVKYHNGAIILIIDLFDFIESDIQLLTDNILNDSLFKDSDNIYIPYFTSKINKKYCECDLEYDEYCIYHNKIMENFNELEQKLIQQSNGTIVPFDKKYEIVSIKIV